jgi:hypothetical protein
VIPVAPQVERSDILSPNLVGELWLVHPVMFSESQLQHENSGEDREGNRGGQNYEHQGLFIELGYF